MKNITETLQTIKDRLLEYRVETRLTAKNDRDERLYHIVAFESHKGRLKDASHYEIRSDYDEKRFATIEAALIEYYFCHR
jgi:hypothetical protein